MFVPRVVFAPDEAVGAVSPAPAAEPVSVAAAHEAALATVTAVEAQPAVAEAEVVKPEAPADPFAEYGGVDQVKSAMILSDGFKTEHGLRQIVEHSLKELGFSADAIAAFLTGEAAAVAPAPAVTTSTDTALEDDDVPTVAQLRQMLESYVGQKLQPFEHAAEQQRLAAAHQAVDSTLASLGVEDLALQQHVIIAAQRYLDPADYDPGHVTEAIKRGHADVSALIEKQRQAYLTDKVKTAETLPTHVGGTSGSPGGTTTPEAQNLQEAMVQVRARLKSGEFAPT